jgi:hypothetical protein
VRIETAARIRVGALLALAATPTPSWASPRSLAEAAGEVRSRTADRGLKRPSTTRRPTYRRRLNRVDVEAYGELPGNMSGKSRPKLVTLRDASGQRSTWIFKAAGSHPSIRGLRSDVHEIAVYELARMLGKPNVPTTRRARIYGKVGSIQRFVDDTVIGLNEIVLLGGAERARIPLNRAMHEELQIFDFLIGNVDRNTGNVLWREGPDGLEPVAIDNGESLLVDYPWSPTTLATVFATRLGPYNNPPTTYLPSSHAFIRSIDRTKVTRLLLQQGIEPAAVARVLQRLTLLHRDPDLLAVSADTEDRKRMGALLTSPSTELSDAECAAIDAFVANEARNISRGASARSAPPGR